MRIKCNLLLVLAITCSYCVVFLLFVRLSPKNEPLKITRIGSLGVHKKQNSDHEPRIILLWTTWFDDLRWLKVDDYHEQLKSCPKQNCIFSRDRSLLNSADAVMFHTRDLDVYDLPRNHIHGQKWVLYNIESPPNAIIHKQNLDMFEEHIDWVASYRRDSDIYVPYGQVIKRNKSDSESKHTLQVKFNERTKPVAWMVSNCNTPSNREAYVRELSKYIDVDIYGWCGSFTCPRSEGDACFEKIAKQYKFYLSFENSICTDYVTEKLFRPIRHDILPVVLGGANYSRTLPKNSFINALDFSTPRALANFLTSINSTTYETYFKWKQKYVSIDTTDDLFCKICQKLNRRTKLTAGNILAKRTFYKWWYTDGGCHSWSTKNLFSNLFSL